MKQKNGIIIKPFSNFFDKFIGQNWNLKNWYVGYFAGLLHRAHYDKIYILIVIIKFQQKLFLMFKRISLGSLIVISGLVITDNTPSPLKSIYKFANAFQAGLSMTYIYKFKQYSQDPNIDISQKHYKGAQVLHNAMKRNGGLYIKLGQLISTLDVIVPDQYRNTLKSLTRDCKVTPFAKVKKTIQQEFQKPLEKIFQQFEQKPISSASIAQVHKAKLLTGQEVAVKVQHRGLEVGVQADLRIMKGFVWLAKRIFDEFKYGWLIEQFEKTLMRELNFQFQAENAERTIRFLKRMKYDKIHVPKIYYPSFKRVLIMEFIQGVHIDEVNKMRSLGINTRAIGRMFAEANVNMIHNEGFVHADPHTGNLMVRKNGKGKDQLVILDHGLYQELSEQMRKTYNQFWLGLIIKDQQMFSSAALKLGTKNARMLCSMLTSKTSRQLFEKSEGKQRFRIKVQDRPEILERAQEQHKQIVNVLNQLRREILLLLKVNQSARTIENLLGGREMGIFQDIARCCVQNLHLPFWRRWLLYLKIYWVNR